jgi:hypothetical protein
MERKTLVIIAGVVAAVTIAAIAFGPAGLGNLFLPTTNPNEPGNGNPGPKPTALDVPTWHEGDSWTYEAKANPSSDGTSRNGPSATGSLTRTVVSADASTYNVSVQGSFHAHWTLNPIPDGSAAGSIMLDYHMFFEDATVDGYTWVRTSDLAIVKEVRTVHFDGSFEMDSGSYNASYTATVETTYDPALNVWAFPLEANETWNATSTATVRISTDWRVDDPHGAWEFGQDHTVTRDVRLFLMSGAAEDIETPAGTFAAIPVQIGTPALGRAATSDLVDVAAGLDQDIPVPQDHSVVMWFSGTAKNVVKVSVYLGGFEVDLALTAYHVS